MAIDKSKLFSLFDNIKQEHRDACGNVVIKQRTRNSDVLIIDGTNRFISTFCVTPTLNDNGEHVGGVSGFLTSIGYAIKLLSPTRVIIVFDGKGGSQRRRAIYPDYKAGRKPIKRLNRQYDDMVDSAGEEKNMYYQMSILADFLTSLPVTVLSIDYIEADDVIAYLAHHVFSKSDEKVTIMSADKDFYQLINERVNVWSPVKKKVYGVQDIVNEYGIYPQNFVFYRVLEGDKSDNIDGIKGIGRKTAIKRFPMLTESTQLDLEKLIGYATDRSNENAIYAKVVEGADKVTRNHTLMQLSEPSISGALQMRILDSVKTKYDLNKFAFVQKLTKYSMHNSIPNHHVWVQEVFYPLSVFKD
jgi:DNA polymerase-1